MPQRKPPAATRNPQEGSPSTTKEFQAGALVPAQGKTKRPTVLSHAHAAVLIGHHRESRPPASPSLVNARGKAARSTNARRADGVHHEPRISLRTEPNREPRIARGNSITPTRSTDGREAEPRTGRTHPPRGGPWPAAHRTGRQGREARSAPQSDTPGTPRHLPSPAQTLPQSRQTCHSGPTTVDHQRSLDCTVH
jgi:hypothetical protein